MLGSLISSSSVDSQDDASSCPKAASFIKSQAKWWATAELISLLRRECNDAFIEQEKQQYPHSYNAIIADLVSRKPVHELIDSFRRSTDKEQLTGLLEVMDHIGGSEIEQALKSMANRNTEDRSLLSLKYFAKRGEVWALAILNDNYFSYGGSSVEWAAIVELFGKYHYEPAAENLAGSVGAASMNLGWAAHQSLEQIYPEANCLRSSPFETEECWITYVKRRQKARTP
jgi:hypothetical protein